MSTGKIKVGWSLQESYKYLETKKTKKKSKIKKTKAKKTKSKGLQDIHGAAWECAVIMNLDQQLNAGGINCSILKDDNFLKLEDKFKQVSSHEKQKFESQGEKAAKKIIELEQLIRRCSDRNVELLSQCDLAGHSGDVRDIIVKSDSFSVGISCKNNHEAVKHPRLSVDTDFAKKWFNSTTPCSQEYFKKSKEIFDQLNNFIGQAWAISFSQEDKFSKIYEPFLSVFVSEFVSKIKEEPKNISEFIATIIGKYDFYTLIKKDVGKLLKIVPMNLYGTLKANKILLPSRFVNGESKGCHATLKFDNGWIFDFRVKNGETKIKKSLKFDVRLLNDRVNSSSIIIK